MPGGGDGYCLCPAGQYLSLKTYLQCPANIYSDVPSTLPNCTSCAPGKVSVVGSTDASQCHDNPVLKAQEEVAAVQLKAEQEKNIAAAKLTAETAVKLTAETAANGASEVKGCLWRLRVMM